ncbi:MAG: HNH endonuclease [Lachnospiraceae bacterium]|nr:HNH endonuclease [Lachnospiraceae bacterium]
MSRTYTYNGTEYKNLIPLCENCHNEQHRKGVKPKKKTFLNEERW